MRVRIFPDDETTEIVYEHVTHAFLEGNNTILTLCLPEQNKHAHWPLSRIRHYDLIEEPQEVK